jgi:hypothetical protein
MQKRLDFSGLRCYNEFHKGFPPFFIVGEKLNPTKKQESNHTWRSSDENQSYISLYRMQAAQLRYDEEQKEQSGPHRIEEILPVLQETHVTQGNTLISRNREHADYGEKEKEQTGTPG